MKPENLASKYKGVRVLVLGGIGFIGGWVVRSLEKAGAELFVAVRDASRCEKVFQKQITAQILEIDLLDRNSVLKILKATAPMVVFNLAGYGVKSEEKNELISWRINADLPVAIIEGLASIPVEPWYGQRLIHAGSALEYGKSKGDLNEETKPMPTTTYGRSKLAGTWAVQDISRGLGLASVTARIFTVYGPGEHSGRLLPSLISGADTQSSIELTDGTQKRDFIFVHDVVEGLLRLGVARTPHGEIVNLATGRLISVRKFAEIAAEILKIPPVNLDFGAISTRESEMTHEPVSIHRLRKYTSWGASVSVKHGIRKTVAPERRAGRYKP